MNLVDRGLPKIALLVLALAATIALALYVGEAPFFRVASEIGGLITPLIGLAVIILQISNWVNIKKIEIKTNSLLDMSNEANRLMGHAAGFKEGIEQNDLVTRTAEAAAKVLREAALAEAMARRAAAERAAEVLRAARPAKEPAEELEPR